MIDLHHPEDFWHVVTLHELCQREHLDEVFVVQCIEHGVAHVQGRDPDEWRFSSAVVLRLEKAYRIHRDLEIHVEDLGLVLELLDERDELEREVIRLRQRLGRWEGF